jgi:hypothetical protein
MTYWTQEKLIEYKRWKQAVENGNIELIDEEDYEEFMKKYDEDAVQKTNKIANMQKKEKSATKNYSAWFLLFAICGVWASIYNYNRINTVGLHDVKTDDKHSRKNKRV